MMQLTVKQRSGKSFDVIVEGELTVDNLKKAIHSKVPKLYGDRQRLTFGDKKVVLSDGKALADYQIENNGPQISWRTVFLVEYFGPIMLHYLFYKYADIIHGQSFERSQVQTVALWLAIAHYVKREFETMFVHRFSHGTMPLRNIFKNSAHYWFLGGAFIAYFIYSPALGAATSRGQALSEDNHILLFSALFSLSEFFNGIVHLTLRNLRPKGSRVRKIPYGLGFQLVSCPNYLFETTAWVSYSLLTGHWSCWIFTVVAAGQMYIWAIKKHKQYLKEFPDYPKNRKPMFPFLC